MPSRAIESAPADANGASIPAALPMTPMNTVIAAGLLALMFVFSNLGVEPLQDFDEGWHAVIAHDIATNDNFLSYTEDGQLTTGSVKPPLYFWAMAICFKLLGYSEFAARLFPAACHVLMIMCVAVFCCRHLNWTVALAAAFLLSTHQLLVYHHGARTADIDAPLVWFLTLTMLGVYEWRGGRMPWWLPLAWSCAVLTKGLATIQILPPLALWLLWERDWRLARRVALVLVLGVLPLAVFLILREQAQPGAIQMLLEREFVGRIATEIDDPEMNGPLFYLERSTRASAALLLGLAITLAAVRFRPRLAQQLQRPAEVGPLLRLLALWAIVPLILFSFAGTKRIWYMYPSLTAALILAAWVLRAGLRQLECARRERLSGLVGLIIMGGIGLRALSASLAERAADHARAAEQTELAGLARREGLGATVLAYELRPVERFALRRAGVGYTRVWTESELSDLLGQRPGRVLILYPEEFDRDVVPLVAGRATDVPYVTRRRSVVLREVAPAPRLSPADPTARAPVPG